MSGRRVLSFFRVRFVLYIIAIGRLLIGKPNTSGSQLRRSAGPKPAALTIFVETLALVLSNALAACQRKSCHRRFRLSRKAGLP
jgi:hypothetical protein